MEIIKEHSRIFQIDKDYKIYYWRALAETMLKPVGSWHFKISAVKRIFFKQSKTNPNIILAKGDAFYHSSSGLCRDVCRKNVKVVDMSPSYLQPNRIQSLSREKLKDVKCLMDIHYGKNWVIDGRFKFDAQIVKHMDVPTVPPEEKELCMPQKEIKMLKV